MVAMSEMGPLSGQGLEGTFASSLIEVHPLGLTSYGSAELVQKTRTGQTFFRDNGAAHTLVLIPREGLVGACCVVVPVGVLYELPRRPMTIRVDVSDIDYAKDHTFTI